MSTPLSEYWLGVEINGQHCAISARQIYASFICKQPLQSANVLRLDGIVVHEGEPVYLKPHHVLLKPVQAALTQGAWSRDCEDPSWVIVLKGPGSVLNLLKLILPTTTWPGSKKLFDVALTKLDMLI